MKICTKKQTKNLNTPKEERKAAPKLETRNISYKINKQRIGLSQTKRHNLNPEIRGHSGTKQSKTGTCEICFSDVGRVGLCTYHMPVHAEQYAKIAVPDSFMWRRSIEQITQTRHTKYKLRKTFLPMN